jgi:dihydroorotase
MSGHLRPGLGNRDGILADRAAQQVAYEARADGTVDVLVSDGQCDATMKGFGDTRDNVPAILGLSERGVLSLPRAVVTMTSNVAALVGELTREDWWTRELSPWGRAPGPTSRWSTR